MSNSLNFEIKEKYYSIFLDKKNNESYFNSFLKFVSDGEYVNREVILFSISNLLSMKGTNIASVIRNSCKDIPMINLRNKEIKITTDKRFYDQEEYVGEWWVIFGNKYSGGGVFNKGFVQEEKHMIESPEAMYRAAIERKTPMSETESIVLTNLVRSVKLDARRDRRVILKKYNDISATSNFICIDAIDHSKDLKIGEEFFQNYKNDEIKNLLLKSYSGFIIPFVKGFNKVNGGKWGTGVFKNHPTMMFLIQMLACHFSGVEEFKFWATEDDDKYLQIAFIIYRKIIHKSILSLDNLVEVILSEWTR